MRGRAREGRVEAVEGGRRGRRRVARRRGRKVEDESIVWVGEGAGVGCDGGAGRVGDGVT